MGSLCCTWPVKVGQGAVSKDSPKLVEHSPLLAVTSFTVKMWQCGVRWKVDPSDSFHFMICLVLGLCFLKRSADEHLNCMEQLLAQGIPVDQAEPTQGPELVCKTWHLGCGRSVVCRWWVGRYLNVVISKNPHSPCSCVFRIISLICLGYHMPLPLGSLNRMMCSLR